MILKSRQALSKFTLAAVVSSVLAASAVAQTRSYRFDISNEPLSQALRSYSQIAEQEIIFTEDLVAGLGVTTIKGEFTSEEALAKLLDGTGLVAERSPSGAIMIRRAAATMPVTSARPISNVSDTSRSATHLAQVSDTSQTTSLPGESPQDVKSSAETGSALAAISIEELLVTGSHIRGDTAAGSNVVAFTREDIDRAGYATVHEFLTTVTQNFSGSGATEDYSPGPFSSSNQYKGASVDLRGLGPDATLVLINGRRTAPSGLMGDFVDISTIPQSAIERIEILTDGASALYGSDAVGGVVNIILRKDYEGAETRLRYGRVTDGDTDEYRLAQMFGKKWNGGNVLLAYEHYGRGALAREDRSYARTRDLRARGGSDYRSVFGSPGNIIDPFTGQLAYAIPRGQDGSGLTVSDLVPGEINYQDVDPRGSLLPEQSRHSGYATLEQAVSDRITLFGEARYSERAFEFNAEPVPIFAVVPATNPFFVDPFGLGSVFVMTNLGPEVGTNRSTGRVESGIVTGGVEATFAQWRWRTYATYGREKSSVGFTNLDDGAIFSALADPAWETALNLFGDGVVNNPQTIRSIMGEQRYAAASRITSASTVLDGPVVSFRGRDISLALGAEYRSEELRSKQSGPSFPTPETEDLSRDIHALFAELHLPLIAPADLIPLVGRLDASFAVRLDEYSDAGDSTNPKFGIRYSPFVGLQFNATYGTSFRAPNLSELTISDNRSQPASFNDPHSPSGRSRALVVGGNDPNTKPENATTWTLGVQIEPPGMKGFAAAIHYASLEFDDRISAISEPQQAMLAFSERYPGIVIRDPDAALLQRLCTETDYLGDPATCTPEFIDVVIDQRSRNIASTTVRSLDGSVAYGFQIGGADVVLSGSATYLLEHSIQQTSASPSVDHVSTYGRPVDFRSRATASIAKGGITGFIAANYTDSYRNPTSPTLPQVSSLTTLDLNVGLSFNGLLRPDPQGRHQLALSVVNMFDENPPFVDATTGYDGGNADPLGRFVSLELKTQW